MLVYIYPVRSCLAKAIDRLNTDKNIQIKLFRNKEELLDCSDNIQVPTYIMNLSRPRAFNDSSSNYTSSTKSILNHIEEYPNISRPFYILASSVGVQAKYINLGDKKQLEYNADRAQAEREFFKSNTSGLILRIPMVPCRDDSLLKRFKTGETTKEDIKNNALKIPVLSVVNWVQDTLAFMRSFNLAKEINLNTIIINYKSEDYSIETLQNSLANSTIFDHLLK